MVSEKDTIEITSPVRKSGISAAFYTYSHIHTYMIHNSEAYTGMNIYEQQPLIILSLGFCHLGKKEKLNSSLSCEIGHL